MTASRVPLEVEGTAGRVWYQVLVVFSPPNRATIDFWFLENLISL